MILRSNATSIRWLRARTAKPSSAALADQSTAPRCTRQTSAEIAGTAPIPNSPAATQAQWKARCAVGSRDSASQNSCGVTSMGRCSSAGISPAAAAEAK